MIVENTSKERLVGSIKPMLVNVAVEPLRTDIAEDIADAILKDYVRRDELGLDEREMREILWNTWIPPKIKEILLITP